MTDRLDNGLILTDEDVDTAQLIKQINDRLGLFTDDTTLRIAATPLSRVRPVVARDRLAGPGFRDGADLTYYDGAVPVVPEPVTDRGHSGDPGRSN